MVNNIRDSYTFMAVGERGTECGDGKDESSAMGRRGLFSPLRACFGAVGKLGCALPMRGDERLEIQYAS